MRRAPREIRINVARFSDFAIDVRKVVEQNSLPEYTAMPHKNEEGEEVIRAS